MLGKVFGIICLVAFCFALFCGNLTALSDAILDGAAKTVDVMLSLCGMMCLWCGMMRVLSDAGAIKKLSRLLSPFLRLFFPQAYRTGEGLEEISANVSANLLGIGNAATPLALQAMKELQKHNPTPERASGEQITLAVLNTASFTLIPANLLALRRAAGSADPYSVILPIWIVSILSASMALLLTSLPRLLNRMGASARKEKRRAGGKDRA